MKCHVTSILFQLTSVLLLLLIRTGQAWPATHSKSGHRTSRACFKNVTQNSPVPNQSIDGGANTGPKSLALYHQLCLDIELPYKTTTLPDYVPGVGLSSIEEVQDYLHKWQEVRRTLPKCWSYLQVALCSILMPQYEEADPMIGRLARISRPSLEMCTDLRKNCQFLERHYGWPLIFNCSDSNLYSTNCTNELRNLRQPNPATPETCQYPLVPSNDSNLWFRDIDGCAIHCKYPVLDTDEQNLIHLLIILICTIGFISTSQAIVLFWANESRNESSRMAKVIKRCNCCQFVFYTGWLLQIFFHDIACSSSGSALYGLPFKANACVLSFLLTYLPSLSNLIWCAYLGRLCHEKLAEKKRQSPPAPENTKVSRFLSISSVGVPLSLFVIVANLGQIDGHGLYGICTVGQQSIVYKIVFIFVPKIISTLYGSFYFIITIFKLMRFEKKFPPSLRRNFARIILLVLFNLMDVIFSLVNCFYERQNYARWMQSIDNYLACGTGLRVLNDNDFDHEKCSLDTKPMVILNYLELFPMLATGIVIASWAFCEANYRGLWRKLIDMLEDEQERKRRVKLFLDVAGSAIGGESNEQLNTYLEASHDLIDLTTRTDNPIDLGQNIIAPRAKHQETNSLASISIASNFESFASTNLSRLGWRRSEEQTQPKSRRPPRRHSHRQQIEDSRRGPAEVIAPNPEDLGFMYQTMLTFLQHRQNYEPPNLNGPESAQQQPQFTHGMGPLIG